jgi:5-formyltetrahydrofolate cyclo-ligase
VTDTSDSAAKDALRERMRAVRSDLAPAAREAASRAIAARVAALPAWAGARTVALYPSAGSEVDAWELGRLALASGKQVAWPRLTGSGRAMEFACCAPSELVAGPARVLEAPPSATALPLEALDLVVVPGLAFDPAGRRLGRGRGHYDATLVRLRPGAVRIGICFEAQVVDRVPTEPHDAPLDAVVTEARVLAPSGVLGGAPGSAPG